MFSRVVCMLTLSVVAMLAFVTKTYAASSPIILHYVTYMNGNDTRLPNPMMMTHLVYAIVRVNEDFSLQVTSEEMLARVATLKDVNPKLKITFLLGGVQSQYVGPAVSTPENRSKLLDNVEALLTKYNLDGVDMDWEFPKNQEESDNYILLMKDFKTRFPNKFLSVTVGAGIGAGEEHFDAYAASKYADCLTLMGYDYSLASYCAPLFGCPIKNNNYVSLGIEKLLSKSVPANKILLGIPFYGISTAPQDAEQPQIAYRGIEARAKAGNYTRCRDEISRVPFYMSSQQKIAISFDDAQSVSEKCQYAKEKGLAGVMVWQCLFDDDNLTLSRAILNEYGLQDTTRIP